MICIAKLKSLWYCKLTACFREYITEWYFDLFDHFVKNNDHVQISSNSWTQLHSFQYLKISIYFRTE